MTTPLVEMATLGPITCGSSGFSQRGGVTVTLVVKATFTMVHAGVAEPCEPEPVHVGEQHHKNNPTRSIRAASDLAPYLRRGEVLFNGHAFAPGGRPAARVTARLAVIGQAKPLVDKTLLIEGDAGPDGPKPFERMPIIYERAFGGAGFADNPLGVGASARAERPNVMDPRDARRSAGFAPISRAWPARKRLLAGADKKRIELPIAELPDAFDWAYFQSAPVDQQCEFFRGDERIVLESLHPTLPWFETRLAGARAAARVFGMPGTTGPRPVGFQLDTLFIDGDTMRCSAVWRATMPVADPSVLAALRVVTALEMPGVPVIWPASIADVPAHAERPLEVRGGDAPANTLMLADEAEPRAFGGTMSLDLEAPAPRRTKTAALPPVSASRVPELKFGTTIPLTDDDKERIAAQPVAPFMPSTTMARAAAGGTPPIPGAPWSAEPADVLRAPKPGVHTLGDDEANALGAAFAANPLPPADFGGLPRPRPLSRPPPAPAPAPMPAAVTAGREAVSVPLEECAAIAAELALARTPRSDVLRAHGLDEAAFRKIEKLHNEAMDRDESGESRSAYDVAFVASVERVRGTLRPDDYAKLLLATERGDLAGALAATGLTRAAWLRVQRVLKRRGARDGAYSSATERALDALRGG